MQTGVSHLVYPKNQPKPLSELKANDSYFLIKVHDAQAFFDTHIFSDAGYLILSSIVEGPDRAHPPIQSVHQISTITKNIPCRLGINTNLTNWLPASADSTLKVSLKYTVIKDTPFKNLVDKMEQMGLAAKASAIQPELSVSIKVSQIAGRFFSYLLQEGKPQEIFSSTVDLNVANLQAGYQVMLGSHKKEEWPSDLSINRERRLRAQSQAQLEKLSYAVIEVQSIPRLGDQSASDEAWWELLQLAKSQALDTSPGSDKERETLFNEWLKTLRQQIRPLSLKARGFLKEEIDQIIQKAQVDVEKKLLLGSEALGDEELPKAWQEVLGVNTEQALRNSVNDYQNALTVSQQLLEQYKK